MLRHTWTTTMSSSEYRDTVQVEYRRDGISGHGEGAPIIRYQEFPASAMKAIQAIAGEITAGDPWKYQKYLGRHPRARWASQQHAAMAAVDIAIFDWLGKKLDVPLYKFLGLDPADAPITDFSIGIDTPEITRQKTREAEDFPVLKVKVGLKTDEATIEAVRSVTNKPIRVDANEGWTDKEEAIRKINWLESQGVEYVEQPMPAHMVEETKYVRSKVHLPIFADEACTDVTMIPKLVDAYDGINVKLDKVRRHSGGLPVDPGSARNEHEGDAGLHGFQFLLGYSSGPTVAVGRLRRSRREPARGQRSVAWRARGKRKTAASRRARAWASRPRDAQ